MSQNELELLITFIVFVATVISWAVKYGSDQQKLRSKNEMQDLIITNLKDQTETNRIHFENQMGSYQSHNDGQHKEFYANRDITTGLKTDMGHIMQSLADIKGMLSDRRNG